MNERELKIVGGVAGAGLLLFILVNGAYDRGYSAALAQRGDPGVNAYGHGPGPWPILLIIGLVAFVIWRRRSQNGGPGAPPTGGGPRGPQPPRFFQEWHAQAHAAQPPAQPPAQPTAGPSPAGPAPVTQPSAGPWTGQMPAPPPTPPAPGGSGTESPGGMPPAGAGPQQSTV